MTDLFGKNILCSGGPMKLYVIQIICSLSLAEDNFKAYLPVVLLERWSVVPGGNSCLSGHHCTPQNLLQAPRLSQGSGCRRISQATAVIWPGPHINGPRVRVPEQLLGTCLFGLESTKLLCVGLTQNISFQNLVEAKF